MVTGVPLAKSTSVLPMVAAFGSLGSRYVVVSSAKADTLHSDANMAAPATNVSTFLNFFILLRSLLFPFFQSRAPF